MRHSRLLAPRLRRGAAALRALAIGPLLSLACSGTPPETPDASVDLAAPPDLAASPDLAPSLAPRRLLPGSFAPLNVTIDGHLVYFDPMAGELRAVADTSPARPATIAAIAMPEQARIVLTGPFVLFQTAPPSPNGDADVKGWSAARGAFPVSSATLPLSTGVRTAGNRDGRYIFYPERATPGQVGVRYMARDTSNPNQPPVSLGARVWGEGCFLRVAVSATHAVVYGCDLGGTARVVRSYDFTANFAEATLVADGAPGGAVRAAISSDGRFVFTVDARAEVVRVPIGGGTPVVVAPASATALRWTADGTRALARTSDERLLLWTEASGKTVEILAASVKELGGVDTTLTRAVIATARQTNRLDAGVFDSENVVLVDLTNGMSTTLLASPTGRASAIPAFTFDGTQVMWLEEVTSEGLGTLTMRAVQGGTTRTLGHAVSGHNRVGSLLILDDDYAGPPFYAPGSTTSIHVLSAPWEPPTVEIARYTALGKLVSPETLDCFFVLDRGKPDDGIYVFDIPP